jgi:hypothetical protein
MRGRLLALLALAAAWVAGAALLRRTTRPRRDRVDLYYDDGSIQSLADGAPEAARLLPLARQALDAARAA